MYLFESVFNILDINIDIYKEPLEQFEVTKFGYNFRYQQGFLLDVVNSFKEFIATDYERTMEDAFDVEKYEAETGFIYG